jgi:hypothetical protein
MRRVGYLAGPKNYAISAVLLLICATASGCATKPIMLASTADRSALRLEKAPTLTEFRALYPPALQRQDVDGLVLVRITVNPDGRVIQTSVLKEEPIGIGLGAIAESLAYKLKFTNGLRRPVITTLPVRFAPLQLRLPGAPPIHSVSMPPGCTGFICPLT